MRNPTPLLPKALLQPAACLLALLAVVVGALCLLPVGRSQAQQGGPDPSAIADQLPPLPATDGEIELPLDGSPHPWVAIGGGPGIEHPEGALEARYTVASGRPAGAALIFRPGTLAGLAAIEIEIRGNRSTQLVPTLRDGDGVVYRFGSVPVQPGGSRTHRLSVADMQYFPGQAEVPDPGRFDAAGAILLSLVDISGFTAAVPPGTEIEWTVTRLTAIVGTEADRAAGGAAEATSGDDEAAVAPPAPAISRRPLAERAEAGFFEIFNHRPDDRSAALPGLMAAFASDPADPRTNLWLGLNHLWLAAEGDRTDPRVIESLILAEHFLGRAQRLDPSDRRIPGWRVPAGQVLARLDGDAERAQELEAELLAAYEEDPDFHSVAVAMAGFGSGRGSAAFARGLEALRGTDAGCAEADPTCGNRPHWPHNVEGFLLFAADYELKAGNRDAARAAYEKVRAVPSYDAWPYRDELEERLENFDLYADLFANPDPTDDPPTLVIAGRDSCQVCHRAD